ncbi:RNA-binding protein [Candidatus Micrarchaeota archaeon]|nr:RNA-binding protein [Candidatus Micrarchaeota archaeon]
MKLKIDEIEKYLLKKEQSLDRLMVLQRETVRLCANSIKAVHAKDMKKAKQHLNEAEERVKIIRKFEKEFPNYANHVYQEYVEAKGLIAFYEGKPMPTYKKLKVTPESYLTGLLDLIGELKREMYENLRKGNKKEAERFFHSMEWIFHELMHLRFSNSVLPEFRRKQDVARIQIEQARGELI